MIWCVGNARERIAQFIDNAQHTLFLQNERYQDAVIIERLVRASRRGVKVHVMARPPHTLKTEKLIEGVGGLRILDDVGVKVHKLRGMKLHAKLLFADGVRDEDVISRIHKVVHHDWKNSHPIDLTDAGLMADLGIERGSSVVIPE